jgi:hypothetical protein
MRQAHKTAEVLTADDEEEIFIYSLSEFIEKTYRKNSHRSSGSAFF